MRVFAWITRNREWFFSGLGVLVITLLLGAGKHVFGNYKIVSNSSNLNTSKTSMENRYFESGLGNQELHATLLESFESPEIPESPSIVVDDSTIEGMRVIQGIGRAGDIFQGDGITIIKDDKPPDIQHAPDDFILPNLQIFDENRERYRDLFYFMEKGDLRMANAQSSEILLKSIGVRPEDYYINDQFSALPCKVLLSVDQIWRYYSNEKFGFAPQLEIKKYIAQTVGVFSFKEMEEYVGDETKWRNNYGEWELFDDLNYSFSAPNGHLPWFWNTFGYIHMMLARYDGCVKTYQ